MLLQIHFPVRMFSINFLKHIKINFNLDKVCFILFSFYAEVLFCALRKLCTSQVMKTVLAASWKP